MHKNTGGFSSHEEAVEKILQSGNLYTALDLTNLASTADVEKSYAYLFNRVNIKSSSEDPDLQTALKVLNEAHEVLKDPYRRKRYDVLLQVIPDIPRARTSTNDIPRARKSTNDIPRARTSTNDTSIPRKPPFAYPWVRTSFDIPRKPPFAYPRVRTSFDEDIINPELPIKRQAPTSNRYAFFREIYKGILFLVFVPALVMTICPVIPKIKVHRYFSNIGPYLIILTMIMLYRYTSPDDACDDYYKILDVPRRSNTSEIKKAYRNMAKKLHPDKKAFNQDTERFQKIVDAYKVLSNYTKRKEYDFECEDGFRKAAKKNESSANSTDGFEKYGLYSFCAGPHWCVNMYYFLQ